MTQTKIKACKADSIEVNTNEIHDCNNPDQVLVRKEVALQQQINELKRDLYAKEEEFQEYKNTDISIAKLEDRIYKN